MMQYLVWIDCEMSGLDASKHHILELALIVTDIDLRKEYASKKVVIHHSEKLLHSMDEWNIKQHKQSGLWDTVLQSTVSYQEASDEILLFLQCYTEKKQSYIAGNSVYHDVAFMKHHLPLIVDWFHYRIVDVSSLKVLMNEWYHHDLRVVFAKKNHHRALDDIRESIEELRHYRKYFFI